MSLLNTVTEAKESPSPNGSSRETNSEGTSTTKRDLKREVHERIVHEMDSDLIREADPEEQREVLRPQVEEMLLEQSSRDGVELGRDEHERMLEDLLDEILGLGPIEELLDDPEVTEVMINGYDTIFVERDGRLQLTNVSYNDEEHLAEMIQRIVAPLGRRVDETSPYVDARLPDGSRVNIVVPPLALNGGTVTIRKFAEDPLTIEDLIDFGTLTESMAEFLRGCVDGALNIVVSGGTGSGKTTTLNCLSGFIPNEERIVTIEDSAELQLQKEHWVRMETRPANIEGEGEVTMRELVKNSLRMRPDRVVVGECRGAEALDMLQAMNTGHDGSLTTLHANNPREALSRLETLVMMAGMELPQKAIREQISSAIDLVVQQARLRDGSRKITQITEIQGMEGDTITRADVFEFDQQGMEDGRVIGEMKATGVRPNCFQKLQEQGVEVPRGLFHEE